MIDERKLTRYIKTEINPYGKPFDGTVFEFGNMLIDYMERMEKEPERKWIPVSERLPEEAGNYLVTRSGYTWVANWFNDTWWGVEKKYRWTNIDAWQPLPEPYKEREEE